MSTARLATHVEVSGLIRRAEAAGGSAYVLAKGDREAGAILILLSQLGDFKAVIDRALMPDGSYRWRQRPIEEIEGKQNFNKFLSARRRVDPDLWGLELNVPNAERFAAQLLDEG